MDRVRIPAPELAEMLKRLSEQLARRFELAKPLPVRPCTELEKRIWRGEADET